MQRQKNQNSKSAKEAPVAILSTIVIRRIASPVLLTDAGFDNFTLEAEDADMEEDDERDFGRVSSSGSSS